jgi:putative phage-type endonuclease
MTKLILSEETLGDAERIGVFESGSQEWLDLRGSGIGGSDVGTICGLNKWESPFTLWAKKTGKISSEIPDNEAMEWGRRLESVILDKFTDAHPELQVMRDVGTWRHKDRHWQIANPDALFFDGEAYGVIEVKTAQYEDDWSDGPPLSYQSQVQWYLQTFGFELAHVIVLFHGNRYREFELPANKFEQDTYLSNVEMFREYVAADAQPDFDGALSTFQTIRQLHPQIEDAEVELGDLGMYYQLAEAELKQAETKFNEMRSRVLDAMGSAKRGLIHDKWVLSRQARNGGTPYLTTKRG